MYTYHCIDIYYIYKERSRYSLTSSSWARMVTQALGLLPGTLCSQLSHGDHLLNINNLTKQYIRQRHTVTPTSQDINRAILKSCLNTDWVNMNIGQTIDTIKHTPLLANSKDCCFVPYSFGLANSLFLYIKFSEIHNHIIGPISGQNSI